MFSNWLTGLDIKVIDHSGGVDLDLNHLVVHLGRGSYSTTFTLLVPQLWSSRFCLCPRQVQRQQQLQDLGVR